MLTDDEVKVLIAPNESLGDKIKILIVEDSPNINLLYDRGLPEAVFEKRFAHNGSDALLAYEEWQPEIIVLDVMLPVKSGYTVLKEIRNVIGDKKTTIIMSTSLSEKDDVTTMMKLGIQGYIIKPFGVRDIGGRILRYLEKVDHQRAEVALLIYEKSMADVMKSLLKTDLAPVKKEEKKDDHEKLMKINPDFSAADFSNAIKIGELCGAVNADNYGFVFKTEDNTIERANEFLCLPNLYEKIMEKKKNVNLSHDIRKLAEESEKNRIIDFVKLDAESQKKIKIMNRLLLQAAYPHFSPEIRENK